MVNLTNTGMQSINKIMMLEKQQKRHTEKQNELKWHLTIRAVREKETINLRSLSKKVKLQAHAKKKEKKSSKRKKDTDKVLKLMR